MSATADQELAELRRANAELRTERDAALAELQARTAALALRDTEYEERIDHQAATIEVLKVMSASPGDPQPVFDLIAGQAQAQCNCASAAVYEFDGMIHCRSFASGVLSRDAIEAYFREFPMPLKQTSNHSLTVSIRERRIVHIRDAGAAEAVSTVSRDQGVQSAIVVPLITPNGAAGCIALSDLRSGGYSDAQIELLQTFAEQAVIAITSAETYRALQTRTEDLQESLNYQTAIGDVLKVISRSTFDLQPVLDTVIQAAARLCDADQVIMNRLEDEGWLTVANFGFPPEFEDHFRNRVMTYPPNSASVAARASREARPVHIHDVTIVPNYPKVSITLGGQRTSLGVPLLRKGEVIGTIVLARRRVEPFTDRQIELVSTFADQAVIAMENARLLNEQREALEQQTATAEMLQVINANPGHLAPVFDAMLEKAHGLCGIAMGSLELYDGQRFRTVAVRGLSDDLSDRLRHGILASENPATRPLIDGDRLTHIRDLTETDYAITRSGAKEARTLLCVPMRREGTLIGMIASGRREVRPFSDKEIALLENFAAQAVIAIENARLLDEIRQRQDELRITFENMGDGVALFDETRHLVASNRRFQDMLDVPDDVILSRPAFADYIRYLADRGEYGPDPEDHVAHLLTLGSQPAAFERMRPNGRILEVRANPVPGGGFVVIYSDITERKRNEEELRTARDAAEHASRTIEAAYRELKAAQANLIQAEKMALLGQLTAGIAHEIKNPLNFVNNFAELSVDLLDELNEAVANNRQTEVEEFTAILKGNLGKIAEHGRRADGIVRGMLEHSRGSSGEQRSIDLNSLVDEALSLAYHGARAQDQNFNVMIERELGDGISRITLVPQDVTRVLLNLLSNAFYAAREQQRMETTLNFEATIKVSTRELGDAVEIRVRDNGIGIPPEITDRLFQPFFTTKPAGAGTGLGLSMSYEIVTQQHGGSISVDSKVGEYSEFTVRLPRRTQTAQASLG